MPGQISAHGMPGSNPDKAKVGALLRRPERSR